MEAAFGHPDDPYRTRIEHRPDGSVSVIVEASVLLGGDTSEVQAECGRRAATTRQAMLDFLAPTE